MLNYPGFAVPQASTTKLTDILKLFNDGYDRGTGLKAEADAPGAFAGLLDSLTGNGAQAQQQPQTLSDLQHVLGAPEGIGGGVVLGANAGDMDSYLSSIRTAESGGNDNARNPNSSAQGRYQVTTGTWNDYMTKRPDLGLTADGRDDPAQQERFIHAFTADNAKALSQAGLPVNPGTLYASHFLGAGGAKSALGYADSTPMVAAVPPEVIKANPFLQGMTVGQFKQWTAKQGGSGGNGGYQPPVAQTAAGRAPMAQGGGNGLPPREVMQQLFANPITRPLAIELAKSAMSGTAAKPIEINGKLVDPNTFQILGDFNDAPKPIEVNGQLVDPTSGRVVGDYRNPTEAPKPVTVNDRLVDPATGKVIGDYSDPPDPYTLGEGQVRFGPDNQPIANGPPKPPGAPDVISVFDEATGRDRKMQWNATSGGYEPIGGVEAPKSPLVSVDARNMGSIPPGYKVDYDDKGNPVSMSPIPGSPAEADANAAGAKSDLAAGRKDVATDTIVNAASIARDLAAKGGNTGIAGNIWSKLSETEAAELRRQVGVLTSVATIENLTAMRQASPTGGALGSVTEKEGAMLAAAAGAIDPNASGPDFTRALDNYERTLLMIVHGPAEGQKIFDGTRKTSGGLPDGVTEDDIQTTMQVHGMTREQVLQQLGGANGP